VGQLDISTKATASFMRRSRMTAEDSGHRRAQAHRAFYRVDVKRSRERAHRLGLAIVKNIVSRHQGRLAIESRPGEGSTFTVFLPVAPAKSRPKVRSPPLSRKCYKSVA